MVDRTVNLYRDQCQVPSSRQCSLEAGPKALCSVPSTETRSVADTTRSLLLRKELINFLIAVLMQCGSQSKIVTVVLLCPNNISLNRGVGSGASRSRDYCARLLHTRDEHRHSERHGRSALSTADTISHTIGLY